MDAAELREVLSPEGLRLLDSLPPYSSAADIVRTVDGLRKAGHPPARIAAVAQPIQAAFARGREVRRRSPSACCSPRTGLEQATRLPVAAQHAGRFARAGIGWVADLGCGIGADALAIAGLELEVTAVERDEVTAAIAAYNLAPFSNARVELADAETFDLAGVGGVFLDPGRRTGSRRLKDPAEWSPSLDFAFGLAARLPTGVKLAPGIDRDAHPRTTRRRSGCPPITRSSRSACGSARSPAKACGDRRSCSATTLPRRWSRSPTARTPRPATSDAYLVEPDGAVIRARLIGDLARELGGRMLDPTIAYITTDTAPDTPFGAGFRVLEDFPLDKRTLKRELAARGIGALEIKKRGVDVDPARLRGELGLAGRGERDPRADENRGQAPRDPRRAASAVVLGREDRDEDSDDEDSDDHADQDAEIAGYQTGYPEASRVGLAPLREVPGYDGRDRGGQTEADPDQEQAADAADERGDRQALRRRCGGRGV